MKTNPVNDALLGVAVGDAVGVPFEFCSRKQMQHRPATDMVGYGTHNQPAGTWSDDTSLMLCLADALQSGCDLQQIARHFVAWRTQNFWAARGEVFDIGFTTATAIRRLDKLLKEADYQQLTQQKYLGDEYDNGNGSLMRILPLLFYIKEKTIEEQFAIIWNVSALTHRHIRAAMSCLIYLRFAQHLLQKKPKEAAYEEMRIEIQQFWKTMDFATAEQTHFQRLIQTDIRQTSYEDLKGSGYVIHTLEASLWCFLMENSYEKTVLKSINLGDDTDTTAAVAGGLAGLYYGTAQIPQKWLAQLARLEDISHLGNILYQKYWAT